MTAILEESKEEAKERRRKFVGYLLGLSREGSEDRGALADLRSGLGKEPGEMARVHRHVVPFLPEATYDDRWYYVLATLFGSFPKHRSNTSLGKAFNPLKAKSDSMEARFVALLNAQPDDLDDHLRHIVSLLKSNEEPIDWFQLLDDLLQWDHPDGHVQLKWARDFYAGGAIRTENQRADDPTNDDQEKQDDE